MRYKFQYNNEIEFYFNPPAVNSECVIIYIKFERVKSPDCPALLLQRAMTQIKRSIRILTNISTFIWKVMFARWESYCVFWHIG